MSWTIRSLPRRQSASSRFSPKIRIGFHRKLTVARTGDSIQVLVGGITLCPNGRISLEGSATSSENRRQFSATPKRTMTNHGTVAPSQTVLAAPLVPMQKLVSFSDAPIIFLAGIPPQCTIIRRASVPLLSIATANHEVLTEISKRDFARLARSMGGNAVVNFRMISHPSTGSRWPRIRSFYWASGLIAVLQPGPSLGRSTSPV